MSRHRILTAVLAATLLTLVPVGHASATVEIVDLEELVEPSGAEPYDINEAGFSAGLATGADGLRHVVRWDPNGAITDLGSSGSARVDAITINERGEVAGSVLTGQWPEWRFRATRWNAGGGFVDLGTLPGGGESWARGIDDRGYVTGDAYARVPHGVVMHAVRWDPNGVITDLDPGGGSEVNSVSGSGFAVGAASGRAVRWDPQGKATMLDVLPGTVASEAYQVNDAGVAVGVAQVENGERAVRWDRQGRVTDLGTLPGGTYSGVSAVSPNGLIAGHATTTSTLSPNHAVRWDRRGTITDLGTLPGADPIVSSFSADINSRGIVIGFTDLSTPVYWDEAGRITKLHGRDGGEADAVHALNDKGFAVGNSSTGATLWRLPCASPCSLPHYPVHPPR